MSDPHDKEEGDSPEQEAAASKAKPIVLSTTTIRSPPWTYFHLTFVTASSIGPHPTTKPVLDDITVRMHLTAALDQFLGLTGTAIPVDILKVAGPDTWIRVPTPDASAVDATLGSWQGRTGGAWRVNGRACWLAALTTGRERDLFEPS